MTKCREIREPASSLSTQIRWVKKQETYQLVGMDLPDPKEYM